jgi:hypothetical protein
VRRVVVASKQQDADRVDEEREVGGVDVSIIGILDHGMPPLRGCSLPKRCMPLHTAVSCNRSGVHAPLSLVPMPANTVADAVSYG